MTTINGFEMYEVIEADANFNALDSDGRQTRYVDQFAQMIQVAALCATITTDEHAADLYNWIDNQHSPERLWSIMNVCLPEHLRPYPGDYVDPRWQVGILGMIEGMKGIQFSPETIGPR